MTDYFENLPGDCFVKQLIQQSNSISIPPKLLAGFGFLPNKSATM